MPPPSTSQYTPTHTPTSIHTHTHIHTDIRRSPYTSDESISLCPRHFGLLHQRPPTTPRPPPLPPLLVLPLHVPAPPLSSVPDEATGLPPSKSQPMEGGGTRVVESTERDYTNLAQARGHVVETEGQNHLGPDRYVSRKEGREGGTKRGSGRARRKAIMGWYECEEKYFLGHQTMSLLALLTRSTSLLPSLPPSHLRVSKRQRPHRREEGGGQECRGRYCSPSRRRDSCGTVSKEERKE